MDIQKKLRSAAHFTVSKASDALEAQRLRFYVRDIQKKKQLEYGDLGRYIEVHPELLTKKDEYVEHALQQLEEYEYQLHHINGPKAEEMMIPVPPAAAGWKNRQISAQTAEAAYHSSCGNLG